MADYDIGAAFERIEDELIDSMMRNFKHHKAEENKEGIQWTQWQAEQLKALEDYKRQNAKKFKKQFNSVNNQLEKAIRAANAEGGMEQETAILNAAKKGASIIEPSSSLTGSFLKLNERKLDTLVKATKHDMVRAETAVLRMANDQYRKIIYSAQVYAATGAGTYDKAVDMAAKDFLAAGINCIEYKNGRRVNIRSYADMALRTASKRAYLQGEGTKRQEWGVSTVILNKRANSCPLCAPFVGKVYIDDVWSGGSKDGVSNVTGLKYPLLSKAIEDGLYHPNCKDSHTTYFEGINTAPEDSEYTTDELNDIAEKYAAEQKQRHAEGQAKKYDRLAKYSLDGDNKRMYSGRAQQWREKADGYSVHKISDNYGAAQNADKSVKKVSQTVEKSAESDIIPYEYGSSVRKEVRAAFDEVFKSMSEKFGRISTISSVESLPEFLSEYGNYSDSSSILCLKFANKKDCLKQHAQKALEMKKADKWSSSHPMHTFRHEIGHAIQAEHAKSDPLWKEKLSKILDIMKSLNEPFIGHKGKYSVSQYAMKDIDEFISECIAESMTSKARGTAKKVANIILGVD